MSLNVVVVVVIALVIMVVLIFVFTGKTKLFSKATTNCDAKGGVCREVCTSQEVSHLATSCAENQDGKTKCCVPFFDAPAKAPTPSQTSGAGSVGGTPAQSGAST